MVAGVMSGDVQEYLQKLVPPRSAEMERMEAHAARTGFPIVGPVAGYFCYQTARMIKATSIFEMGSGYGYSTAWFARAVAENGGGAVHHVVWDEALSRRARAHLDELGYEDVVTYHVAEAVETLQGVPGPFDLIFIDIVKTMYPDALPIIEEKLRSGGVLIADNVLWSGRVLDPAHASASTEAILAFTERLVEDPGWIVSVVPIRDGLAVAYKV